MEDGEQVVEDAKKEVHSQLMVWTAGPKIQIKIRKLGYKLSEGVVGSDAIKIFQCPKWWMS